MALTEVDRTGYRKEEANPPVWDTAKKKWYYFGWHPRGKAALPTKILLHTTNGQRGSSLDGEARFLRDANKVGAHYLIGKYAIGDQHQTRVIRIVDPRGGVAWHAGVVIKGWDNNPTIGIEMHYTPGEIAMPLQIETCALLILDLCAVYPIGDFQDSLLLHRHVALPKGRKSDASNLPNDLFYPWRDQLTARRKKLGI